MEEDLEARRRERRRKSNWKRPKRILGLWSRLALLLAVIIVLVFFAIGLVTKAVRPYREASLQSRQLMATRQESDTLAAENAELTRRIQYLKTSDGIASEARTYGYLRPGERPIMVKDMPQTAAPQDAPTAAPTRHGSNVVGRFWNHLTGH